MCLIIHPEVKFVSIFPLHQQLFQVKTIPKVNDSLELLSEPTSTMADHTALTVEKLFNIKGWVCIVTGGGTGLGLMTANTLAANGAKVYITGRRKEKLQSAQIEKTDSGGSITAIQLDVTDKQSILDLTKQIGEKEKYVNLLVNNPGQTSVNYGEQWTPSGDPKEVSERMLSYQVSPPSV